MASKSGMDYSKVQTLIEDLNTKKVAIIDNLTELSSEAPTKIATHYSGEAAETFKTTLTTTINTISETLDSMISTLRTNTEQKQTDYENQDRKMQESATIG